MQTYLNNNSFREKIFRLRVNEETFNVNRTFIYFFIFTFLFQGYDDGENLVCINQ